MLLTGEVVQCPWCARPSPHRIEPDERRKLDRRFEVAHSEGCAQFGIEFITANTLLIKAFSDLFPEHEITGPEIRTLLSELAAVVCQFKRGQTDEQRKGDNR